MPEIGENVRVWPHPGRNVRSHAELNRMLPSEGMELPWSAWLEEQLGQGMVHLTDPKASIKPEEAKKRIAAAQADEAKAASEAERAKLAVADEAPASVPASPESPPVETPSAVPAPTFSEGK